jgi:PucR C-terminal helix-turn-helix domain
MARAWRDVTDLIESVAASPALLAEAVEEVRSSSREIAALEVADVARHTRTLLVAATRAIAAQRGPTEAELSFIEDLGVTRARQGVPITAVLGAIHVAQRRIWSRAREIADAEGVDPGHLLEARQLYDDWAEDVRQRLLRAHRQTETAGPRGSRDRQLELLGRLLQGGSSAALAAAAGDLPTQGLTVLVAPGRTWTGATALVNALRAVRPSVVGPDGSDVVGVVSRVPASLTAALGEGEPVGAAGPGSAEDLPVLRRLAAASAAAGAARGRTGVVHVAEVSGLAALHGRGDLAGALLDRHRQAIDALGRPAGLIVETTQTWLELGRDADRAAAILFVHPNTVRNRVGSLTAATGLDPGDTFAAFDLWWLCQIWSASTPDHRWPAG